MYEKDKNGHLSISEILSKSFPFCKNKESSIQFFFGCRTRTIEIEKKYLGLVVLKIFTSMLNMNMEFSSMAKHN